MKNKKEIITIFFIIIIISYIIFNTTSINNTIIYATKLFFYKVFPFLFTMIILNELLLNNNILFYLDKIFKKNGVKYYVILMSLLSGSPTSIYLIKELHINKIIEVKDANKLLLCSHFSNPIFLISILSSLFNKKIVLIIILCHYLPNFIISFFIKINPNKNNLIIKNNDFNTILNKAINTSLMVLGTLSVYILISNIIADIFNILGYYSVFLKGLLEITQGLNEINNLFIPLKKQVMIAIIFINFGGLSIHSQIKSIISDTPMNYNYYLIGRISSILFALIILII